MDAIILFSHGSVLCGAERNLHELAERMRSGENAIVEVAFLNYSEPPFSEAVERCLAQGASRILVAPYFLVEGKFVVEDLPHLIADVRAAHPDVEFVVADVIGFHDLLADAVISSAGRGRDPQEWLDSISDAYEWCRENPRCPVYGTGDCRARVEARA